MSRSSCAGVPVGGQFFRPQQPNLAGPRVDDTRLYHPAHTGVLGLGQGLRNSVVTLVEPVLVEPNQRPPAVRIEVALLLSEDLVEGLIDKSEGVATETRFPVASNTFA